jgi:hypothetical protein
MQIRNHGVVWEVLLKDFNPIVKVALRHRVHRMGLKKKLWRGFSQYLMTVAIIVAVAAGVSPLLVRKVFASGTAVVGVDHPVRPIASWAT